MISHNFLQNSRINNTVSNLELKNKLIEVSYSTIKPDKMYTKDCLIKVVADGLRCQVELKHKFLANGRRE